MKRRSFFTLLELLIAMGLVAMLLTTISYYYLQLVVLDQKTEQLQNEIYQLAYLESRLAQVLPRAVPEGKRGKPFFFYTASDSKGGLFKEGTTSLVFVYDNGIDLDKKLANEVVGRLFVDTEGRLTLASWPVPKRWDKDKEPPMKKEILLDGVEAIRFSFYYPPQVDQSKVVGKVSPQVQAKRSLFLEQDDHWYDSWLQDYYMLPAIMRIELERKAAGEPVQRFQLAFPLPNASQVIYYQS